MDQTAIEKAERISMLAAQKLAGVISEADNQELNGLLSNNDRQQFLTIDGNILDFRQSINVEEARKKVESAIAGTLVRKHTRRQWSSVVGVAASILIVFLIAGYLRKRGTEHSASGDRAVTTINSGMNSAVRKPTLILPDGNRIDLTEKRGIIRSADHSTASNDSNRISYGSSAGTAGLNTLLTPVGGQYQIVFSDGTKVWLNALSVLRYPSSFNGNVRSVELLEGEAYFEVAKDALHPFYVAMNTGTHVQVLGTRFNISCYSSDRNKEFTLLEGAIEVTQEKQSRRMLDPGRVVVGSNGVLRTDSSRHVEDAIAWKDGFFSFDRSNIWEVMAEASRWYGIDVQITGDPSGRLTGRIFRSSSLPEFLKMIEISGGVHSSIRDGKVSIYP